MILEFNSKKKIVLEVQILSFILLISFKTCFWLFTLCSAEKGRREGGSEPLFAIQNLTTRLLNLTIGPLKTERYAVVNVKRLTWNKIDKPLKVSKPASFNCYHWLAYTVHSLLTQATNAFLQIPVCPFWSSLSSPLSPAVGAFRWKHKVFNRFFLQDVQRIKVFSTCFMCVANQ